MIIDGIKWNIDMIQIQNNREEKILLIHFDDMHEISIDLKNTTETITLTWINKNKGSTANKQ